MAYADWNLTELRRSLRAAAARVQAVKRTIDWTGMRRPPRDPVERRWLEQVGGLAPGEAEDSVAGEHPPDRGDVA